MDILKGKRTYLVSSLLFALGGAYALGLIDESTFKLFQVALTGAGLAALRGAIK